PSLSLPLRASLTPSLLSFVPAAGRREPSPGTPPPLGPCGILCSLQNFIINLEVGPIFILGVIYGFLCPIEESPSPCDLWVFLPILKLSIFNLIGAYVRSILCSSGTEFTYPLPGPHLLSLKGSFGVI